MLVVGRWSCDRCSICMRCGATKPEGLPMAQLQTNSKQSRHRRVKWVNEYRVDHITKIKEHWSMLCVPCGRMRTTKRVQIATHNNTTTTYMMASPGSSGALSPNCSSGQISPAPSSTFNHNVTTTTSTTANAPMQNDLALGTTEAINITSATETLTTATVNTTAHLLDAKMFSSSPSSATLVASSATTSTAEFSATTSAIAATTTDNTTTTTTASSTSSSGGGPPPVVA